MEHFVHSLVITNTDNQVGWCAPAELGEVAAHGVAFVIPVNENGELHDSYTCETVKGLGGDEPVTESHQLVKAGGNSFHLSLEHGDITFVVRPSQKSNRHLPYSGKLRHPDFEYLLVEIEPQEQAALDRLCEETGEFIIGCDPFLHYGGVEHPAPSAALSGHRRK